jgi:hypothetical protein
VEHGELGCRHGELQESGWVREASYWQPLQVNGTTVDLTHLEPFIFSVSASGFANLATLKVRFHDHCFTTAFDPASYVTPIRSSQASAHEKRTFDPVRYELSKTLPGLVRGFDGKRIASTREGNLVRIELESGLRYAVFFTLRREGPMRCGLFVVSAYPLDDPRKSFAVTGEMRFNTAVGLVLSGKRPKFPLK